MESVLKRKRARLIYDESSDDDESEQGSKMDITLPLPPSPSSPLALPLPPSPPPPPPSPPPLPPLSPASELVAIIDDIEANPLPPPYSPSHSDTHLPPFSPPTYGAEEGEDLSLTPPSLPPTIHSPLSPISSTMLSPEKSPLPATVDETPLRDRNWQIWVQPEFDVPYACKQSNCNEINAHAQFPCFTASVGVEGSKPVFRIFSGNLFSSNPPTLNPLPPNLYDESKSSPPPAIVSLNYEETFALYHYTPEIQQHLTNGEGIKSFALTRLSEDELENLSNYDYWVDVSTHVQVNAGEKTCCLLTYGRGTGGNQMHQWLVETGRVELCESDFGFLAMRIQGMTEYMCMLSHTLHFLYPRVCRVAGPVLAKLLRAEHGSDFKAHQLRISDPRNAALLSSFAKVHARLMSSGFAHAVCYEIEKQQGCGVQRVKIRCFEFNPVEVISQILNQIELVFGYDFLISPPYMRISSYKKPQPLRN
jgi:hypothetical protein